MSESLLFIPYRVNSYLQFSDIIKKFYPCMCHFQKSLPLFLFLKFLLQVHFVEISVIWIRIIIYVNKYSFSCHIQSTCASVMLLLKIVTKFTCNKNVKNKNKGNDFLNVCMYVLHFELEKQSSWSANAESLTYSLPIWKKTSEHLYIKHDNFCKHLAH